MILEALALIGLILFFLFGFLVEIKLKNNLLLKKFYRYLN